MQGAFNHPIIIWKYVTESWWSRLWSGSGSGSGWVCVYENGLLPGVHTQMTLEQYYQQYPDMRAIHQSFLQSDRSSDPLHVNLLADGTTVLIDRPRGIHNCFYESHHYFHLTNNLQLIKLVNNKIRQPLSDLVGAIILADNLEWSTDQQHILEIIKASNYRLISLVNDLVDTIDIVQGNVHLQVQACDLVPLVQQTISMMTTRAQQRQITFEWESKPESPVMIQADATRVKQILIYLFDNAVLYSRQYTTIKVKLSADQLTIVNRAHDQVVIDPTKGFGVYIAKRLAGLMGSRLFYTTDSEIVYTHLNLPPLPG